MADTTSPFGFPYPEDTDLVRDGAQDIENLAEGVNDQLALGYLYVGTRYYTSSGTFAKADPFGDSSFAGAKLRAIRVRCVGGGGGGAGAQTGPASSAAGGAGGGGAGYAERFFTDIANLDTSVTVTRGGGGAGGVGTAEGSAGGTSQFGTGGDAWLTAAAGGPGGTRFGNTASVPILRRGTLGGVGTQGDLLAAGSPGSGPFLLVRETFGAAGGGGGSSLLGGGGNAVQAVTGTFVDGEDGIGFGGGGSGAIRVNDAGDGTGGAGSDGIVIIDVFA